MKKKYVVLYYDKKLGYQRSCLMRRKQAKTYFDIFEPEAEMLVKVIKQRKSK